jgi:CxxC-x17-CxxC domain-containing protein
MSFQDKSIVCSDCWTTFTVSAEKQKFCQAWGYTIELKRCPSCCWARKSEEYGTGGYGHSTRRQMFPAVCAECGRDTKVPFEPRAGRRVYCGECYHKVRVSR